MARAARYTEHARWSDLHAGIEAVWTSLSDRAGHYRVLPDGRCDIILKFLPGPASTLMPTVVVTGPTTRYYDVPLVPGMGFVGVRLRPGYSRAVIGLASREIRDKTLTGPAALAACPHLAALCQPAADAQALVRGLCDYVQRRNTADKAALPALTQQILNSFHASSGRLPVHEIAAMHGLNVRTLQRLLIQSTGLPPKAFASILRFHYALRLLRDHRLNPAQAAFEAGFADQAHMGRVLRRMGGLTPARLPDVTLVTLRG